jgi:hypothetical protein
MLFYEDVNLLILLGAQIFTGHLDESSVAVLHLCGSLSFGQLFRLSFCDVPIMNHFIYMSQALTSCIYADMKLINTFTDD